MQRKPYFSGIGKIARLNVGILYILFNAWLLFHSRIYVPETYIGEWEILFISYGVLNAMIFGVADIRNKLFNAPVTEFVPRFLFFTVAGGIVFYMLLNYYEPVGLQFYDALKNVPIWLIALHAGVFATTESAIWQGYLDEEIGHPWSELSAGLFHWGIWKGSFWVVVITTAFLFGIFSVVNWRFRKNKDDLSPAVGTHFAWNLVKLMFGA